MMNRIDKYAWQVKLLIESTSLANNRGVMIYISGNKITCVTTVMQTLCHKTHILRYASKTPAQMRIVV